MHHKLEAAWKHVTQRSLCCDSFRKLSRICLRMCLERFLYKCLSIEWEISKNTVTINLIGTGTEKTFMVDFAPSI